MKIISGSRKGRKLKFVSNKKVRPTTQMVKGALFNILGQDLSGRNFLDLFAGTGSIGLEALSRSAASAVFVEQDPALARMIKENLALSGLTEKGRLFCLDVVRFFKKKLLNLKEFELIFLDPPYASDSGAMVMQELGENGILDSRNLVIFEHHRKSPPAENYGRLEKFRTVNYGDSALSFFKVKK